MLVYHDEMLFFLTIATIGVLFPLYYVGNKCFANYVTKVVDECFTLTKVMVTLFTYST